MDKMIKQTITYALHCLLQSMKLNLKTILFLPLLVLLFTACSDDETLTPPEPPEPTVENTTLKLNKFIRDAMDELYLWEDKLPDLDYKAETDSKEYFDKLLYKEEDRWSWITDDVEGLLNSFNGNEKSFGWVIGKGKFSNTGALFAWVIYVNPNTPASRAGIKRGDLIVQINNADITEENYKELFDADNLTISIGEQTDSGVAVGASFSISSEELELNPVVKTTIVEHENHKIGYIFYTQYITDYNTALDTALSTMIENQVTDLVIDLRYNQGGYLTAAKHLCSSVAPLADVNNERRLVTKRYNNDLQRYFADQQLTYQLEDRFDKNVPVKMGLDRIYFLTGPNTASASELTITGLSPYMTVKTVGATTSGKYTGSWTITPDMYYDSESHYESFKNWALQPIIFRYANSSGVTDFKDGFEPTIPAEDDYFTELGTKEEPLLKAAIEDITGIPVVVALKSASKPLLDFELLELNSSRFDKYKRYQLLDDFYLEAIK